MTLKQQIHQHYTQLVQDKIDVFKDMIEALTEDSKNDAKGSAGDKHETALSMMHIEQEKLTEYLDQKTLLDKIDAALVSKNIGLGSIVKTNGMLLFLSSALPKITVENQTIIAVSAQSPLGSQLLGNQVGFEFEIHGTKYRIEEIH
jgi:hypothetical protein